MADVRYVENRKRSFILAHELNVPLKIVLLLRLWNNGPVNSTKTGFVEKIYIHLPVETSAFLAILYYL